MFVLLFMLCLCHLCHCFWDLVFCLGIIRIIATFQNTPQQKCGQDSITRLKG